MRYGIALLALFAHATQARPEQSIFSSSPRSLGHVWTALTDKVITAIWSTSNGKHTATTEAFRRAEHRKVESPVPKHMLAQYGGDVVLRFYFQTSQELEALKEAVDTLLIDVWEFSHDWVDIRIAENLVSSLLGLLPTTLHDAHIPLNQDLPSAVFDTFPQARESARSFTPSRASPSASDADSNIFFSNYQPLSVIIPWMRLLSSLFTTHTRLITIGRSFEGRDIHALRIGVHPTNRQDGSAPKRKTVLIAAGLHAREWITTSTATYVAYSLITSYGKSAFVTRLLEDFDFVIVPTVNPDGYVYTWETDRLWRKNRQQTPLRFCQGLDLDHSFGFAWDGDTAGNACSESYAGERPFQGTEARQLADWARNETDNGVELVSFIDLHSYSQQILYPYGYSCEIEPPGLEDLQELAYGLEKAIRVSHGHLYEAMPACRGRNGLSLDGKKHMRSVESPGGTALDYFYHELRARWSYQIKLRDRGTYGFLLPPEHIVPSGKEIFDATLYLGSFLTEVYELSKARPQLTQPSSPSYENVQPVEDQEDSFLSTSFSTQWELRRKRR